MPGIPYPCLNTIQPIVGVDIHNSLPPMPPAPMPHVVVWGVGLSAKMGFPLSSVTSRASSPDALVPTNTVSAGWGYACGRQHDAGPHGGHIWANTLLPIIALGAGSKNEFGSGSVKVKTQAGPADMAVGILYAMDLSLDCGDPVSLPTGYPITLLNTVYAGLTWADVCRGLVSMLVDWALTSAASLLGGAIVKGIGKVVGGIVIKAAMSSGIVARGGQAVLAAVISFPKTGEFVTAAVTWAVGAFAVGSPLGYSAGYTPGGKLAGAADAWADSLFR